MNRWRLAWPVPGGWPTASGVLKSAPEDFRVTEQLDIGGPVQAVEQPGSATPPGEGEHLFIYLEKTGDNTPWVAQQLGELAGCGLAGVGFSGLKDRHAVTRQWFSVQRPGLEAEDGVFLASVAQHWPVLAAARRHRKLRRGDHHANHFHIVLRDLDGDVAELESRLHALAREGCPNYFGLQRFGHGGNNLERAVAMASQPRWRRRGRRSGSDREGLYFSAARSWLFNEVLAERVQRGDWRTMLGGEPAPQPSGPLWGDGGTEATAEQGALERSVVSRTPEIEAVFASTRMAPERRPLVLMPDSLAWSLEESEGEDCLALSFTLAPGQYATTVMASVLGLREPS